MRETVSSSALRTPAKDIIDAIKELRSEKKKKENHEQTVPGRKRILAAAC